MSRKETYETKAESLILPILEAEGLTLWDMEYVREGSNMILRAYIDKEGGVDINDCEKVSRAFSDALDNADFIPDAYIMEVSSPGIDRVLKKDRHLQQYIGTDVELHTYKPVDGYKEFVGSLKEFDDKELTITVEDEETLTFDRKNISRIRLYIEW